MGNDSGNTNNIIRMYSKAYIFWYLHQNRALELHKSSHSESRSKRQLKRYIILDSRTEVDAREIFLQSVVWDDVNAVTLCPLFPVNHPFLLELLWKGKY